MKVYMATAQSYNFVVTFVATFVEASIPWAVFDKGCDKGTDEGGLLVFVPFSQEKGSI